MFDPAPCLRHLLDHDSFPQAGALLRRYPLLMGAAADAVLAEWEAAGATPPAEAVAQLRAFLARCQQAGLDAVAGDALRPR